MNIAMFWIVLLGFFGLLLLAGGAVLGLCAWHNKQQMSLLDCPRSRVDELQPGFHKIRGKVVPLDKELRSLVADKECVYYRLRVYRDHRTIRGGFELPGGTFTAFFLFGYLGALLYRIYEAGSDSRTSHSRYTLIDEQRDIPLAIEDDTGCVEVDLRGATILTKEKMRIVSDVNRPPPVHLDKFLRENYDIDTVDSRGFFKTLQFIEEWLPVGAKVTVIGPVERLKSGDLCFQKSDALFIIIERGLDKEIESARSRTFGYLIGSGSAAFVGLACLLGFVLLVVRVLLR